MYNAVEGREKMNVEYVEIPELKEPEITIRASELTPEISKLIASLTADEPIRGWRGDEMEIIPLADILRFYTDGKGVSLETASGAYSVRERIYELEEKLTKREFVRISNSEIVNIRHIKAIDLSFTGTIRLTLTGGRLVFSSRRYIKKLKEVVGV